MKKAILLTIILLLVSTNCIIGYGWGIANDIPVGGDFNRDHRSDRGVYRESNNTWYFDYNWDGRTDERLWSDYGDGSKVFSGDFDSDGYQDDVGHYYAEYRFWEFDMDHDNAHPLDSYVSNWGIVGDLPIVGDFDRNGFYNDIAVYRSSTRTWYYNYRNGHTGTDELVVGWGRRSGDIPFAGDLDGDGYGDDVGVYRQSNGVKYADYDHDGDTDAISRASGISNAVPVVLFRNGYKSDVYLYSNGSWYAPDPDSPL